MNCFCLNLHFHLYDSLTRPGSNIDDGGGGGLSSSVAKPTPGLVNTSFRQAFPPGGEVSPWFYLVGSDLCPLQMCFPLCPELIVFLSADSQILAGQPQAVVEMDQDNDERVVNREGRPGGETGREPLDENEEDVFHDDEERPEAGNLERFGEVEKISPVFPSVAPEYMISDLFPSTHQITRMWSWRDTES